MSPGPLDVGQPPLSALRGALDEFSIAPGWVIADALRAEGSSGLSSLESVRLDHENQAFRNLVVGQIAERIFRDIHLAPLASKGFAIADYVEKGDNRDYGVLKDGVELPINVKTASTLFRNAKTTVGLEAEDCIPISAYKAIGASERVPDLVYVDLVDFELREKADRYISGIEGGAAILWDLFSSYSGKGARKAQDQFVRSLFATHGAALQPLATDVSRFRVISAQRVLAIMRDNPRRCPGLGVPGAGTGTFVSEVNIHVSVENETKPWSDVAAMIEARGIPDVLALVRKKQTKEVSAPEL